MQPGRVEGVVHLKIDQYCLYNQGQIKNEKIQEIDKNFQKSSWKFQ
jgi:hypothetical protein